MSDVDQIMEGFVISLFVFAGLSGFAYCIRMKMRKQRSNMKQSPSMEDLTSVDTTDPQSIV